MNKLRALTTLTTTNDAPIIAFSHAQYTKHGCTSQRHCLLREHNFNNREFVILTTWCEFHKKKLK